MAYVSDYTAKKKKELENYESVKPGEYQSQYQGTLNSLLDQVVNRKQFSYDFNADPLYQQYKDSYVQQGNQAMMNTMANAATLTGGYGNSYATAAGAQANQQYLSQLNNVIPELYQAAMDKYNMDMDSLMNQYSAVTDAEGRDYSRYADALANYNANRDYLYGQYMDSVGQDQYREQFDYQQAQDAVANSQWQSQFDYQKEQDKVAYQQWLDQFDYQKEQDTVANNQWQSQFDYQKEQDKVAYQQWLDEFNYQKEQDALDRAASQASSGSGGSSSGGSGSSYSSGYSGSSDNAANNVFGVVTTNPSNKEQVSSGLNSYVANKTPTIATSPTVNNLASFVTVSNAAAEKAKTSIEAAKTYLDLMVSRGTITQVDADKIYGTIKKENSNKSSNGSTGNTLFKKPIAVTK